MPEEYQKFPISNFRTGFDEALEPWLLPRDGYQIIKNAHLYRGVLEKIPGYDLYASMSYREEVQLSGTINGTNKVFTGTLAHTPSTNNFSAQSAIDTGGTITEVFRYSSDTPPNIINLVSVGLGDGTVDLTNPLAPVVTLNFNTAPAVISGGYNSVIFSYDYFSTAPAGQQDIMGIKQYYAANGGQDILVFDTRRVGKIVSISGIMAQNAGADNGITEIPHEVQVQGATFTPAFDGMAQTFTGTIAAHPVVPGSVEITLYNDTPALLTTVTDNGAGLLTGVGTPTATGFINYATGAWTLTFSVAPASTDTLNTSVCVYGDVFTGDYTNFFSVANYKYFAFITNNVDPIRYYDGMCLEYLNTNLSNRPGDLNYDITKTLHVAIYHDRLLLVLPTTRNPAASLQNDIYWSAIFNPLDFTNNEHLPAPTSESIRLFSFINTDMIVRFSSSERVFRYTGDAFSPFRWDSTNNLWRCDTRYSEINYDSWFSSVGKPAIVGSDGVNVQRADEIIPDFTLNDRAQLEGPLISIQQKSMGQCYGERFDDFKEGWMCFKAYTESSETTTVERSDNILAFNYLDNTYAIYTFPFNVLGFGTINSVDTWGNNFDLWGNANYTWDSVFENFAALVDLAGDQYGNVYTLGDTNSLIESDGSTGPVLFDVITKNFNPFIEDGQVCRFGYLDLFVSANTQTKLRVQFYRDDTLAIGSDGNPTGAYQETTLTFLPTDAMSPITLQKKVWKRIYIGAIAREHTIRLYQNPADFTDTTLNQPVRIHAMVLYMKPAGRIFN